MADDDGVSSANDGADEFDDDYEFGDDGGSGEVEGDGGSGERGGARTAAAPKKRSVRNVPREPLETSVAHIDKMFDAFGDEASQEALAVLLGHDAASGGAWKTRLGTLRAYGLLSAGDPVQLTEIGQDIVRSDRPSTQLRARRQALVASTPFRELHETYVGRSLPDEDGLATKCRFDFRLKQDGALEVARVFASSLRFAGLLGEGDVVLPIDADEPAETPVSDSNPDSDDEPGVASPSSKDPESPEGSSVLSGGERLLPDGEIANPPPTPSVSDRPIVELAGEPAEEEAGGANHPSLEVTVKLKGYSGREVVHILRTIGYGDATS